MRARPAGGNRPALKPTSTAKRLAVLQLSPDL
jgi:hypothetical protein